MLYDQSLFIGVMDVEDWVSSSDSEVHVEETNDEEHCYTSGDLPNLQFRRDMSKARWNNEMRMAEIVENKGSLWTTTGIVRSGMVYCSVEDNLFLAEVGALHVLDDDNTCFSLEDIYKKVAKGEGGCCWEPFEVYRHLKSLSYIVGWHSVPWTRKCSKSKSVSLEDRPEFEGILDKECEDKCQITEQLNNMQMNEVRSVFDVYPPNSKFKKSSPGNPSFVLCITSGKATEA